MHTSLQGLCMEQVSSKSCKISEEVEKEVCVVSLFSDPNISVLECGCHTVTGKFLVCPCTCTED